MPVAQPSSWQRAYKDFNDDQERFLADARLGKVLGAPLAVGAK
jgi:hypothetical protein